jgi:hypothetical protein
VTFIYTKNRPKRRVSFPIRSPRSRDHVSIIIYYSILITHTVIGGDDLKLMLSSSSSKKEATSCVDIAKSSKHWLVLGAAADSFKGGVGVGAHCFLAGGEADCPDGVVVAFLFA